MAAIGIPGIVIPTEDQVAALSMTGAPAIVRTVEAEAPHGPRIAVVDYHKGNLTSVARGLANAGADAFVTDDASEIARAAAAVIPGVGAFDDAMSFMRASGQADAVWDLVRDNVPVLGICLGMQVLFSRGNEHAQAPAPGEEPEWVAGLCLMEGEVTRLPAAGVKVPHVGWNTVRFTGVARSCPIFAGVPDESYFYFTHSYACVPDKRDRIVSTTEHGTRFASSVWNGGNLFGVQFHPEKSAATGAVVLRNFVRVAAAAQGLDPEALECDRTGEGR